MNGTMSGSSSTTPVRVEVDGVTKTYGNKRVLDDVSLNVYPHEVVCLIGASGSGKSTLLKCINDLVSFESGSIRLDGVSIHDPHFGNGNCTNGLG